jgi:hypothetical protein
MDREDMTLTTQEVFELVGKPFSLFVAILILVLVGVIVDLVKS